MKKIKTVCILVLITAACLCSREEDGRGSTAFSHVPKALTVQEKREYALFRENLEGDTEYELWMMGKRFREKENEINLLLDQWRSPENQTQHTSIHCQLRSIFCGILGLSESANEEMLMMAYVRVICIIYSWGIENEQAKKVLNAIHAYNTLLESLK
jgi:hypothetical protein